MSDGMKLVEKYIYSSYFLKPKLKKYLFFLNSEAENHLGVTLSMHLMCVSK